MIAAILDVNPLWLIGKSDRQERVDGKTYDICVALNQAITYVQETPNLRCGIRPVTDNERRIVTNILQLAKDILDKGE